MCSKCFLGIIRIVYQYVRVKINFGLECYQNYNGLNFGQGFVFCFILKGLIGYFGNYFFFF